MNKKYKKRLKIIFLSIVCFCIIVGFSIFNFKTNFFNIELNKKQLELEKTAEIKTKSVQKKYDEMTNSLIVLANIVKSNKTDKETVGEEMFLLSEVGYFDYVGVSDAEGNAIDSNMIPVSIKNRDYFKNAMAGQISISDVIISQVNDLEVQVISLPIEENGNVLGVVFGVLNIKTMDQLLENETGSYIYTQIVDSKGNYITKNQTKDSLIKHDNVWDDFAEFTFVDCDVKDIENNINNGESGSFYFELDNERRVSYYMPLGLKGYYIFSTINREYIDSWAGVINEQIVLMVAQIVIAFSILLISLAWFIRALEKDYQEAIVQKKENEKVIYQKQAEIDGLTCLYNATTVKRKIDEYLSSSDSENKVHIFFLMDLDNFKQVNDNLGHQVGDEVLKDVADTLRRNLRESDIIGRLGGDEFVALLTNATEFEKIKSFFDKMCKLLEKSYSNNGITISISSSFGVVELPKYGNSFQEVYAKADKALYDVKRRNKNGYIAYES